MSSGAPALIHLNDLAILAAQGLSAPAIARHLGVAHSTVQRTCKRHSIPICSGYGRGGRISPSMWRAAVEKHGPSPRRLARELGVSLGYVRKLMDKHELDYDAKEVRAKAAANAEQARTTTTTTWRGGQLTVTTKVGRKVTSTVIRAA